MKSKSGIIRSQPCRLPVAVLATLLLGVPCAQAQEVAPLNQVTVPDVNMLGLLDGTGNGAWLQVTQPEKKRALQGLGKALFWDMQVGGDGVTACATCHYHAGADHRRNNQMSPGLKGGDFELDLLAANQALTSPHYGGANDFGTVVGFPVNESHLLSQGWSVDATDGTPGSGQKGDPGLDINDIASSQGVRAGVFTGLSGERVDFALLATTDEGFNVLYTELGLGIPATARRVEPRNAPTVINAVYNLRNFWDGRADSFFNGVSPLGFRDPTARVKAYVDGQVADEKLLIPFSSLASQAVGPPLSDFEMQFANRKFAHIGRKLSQLVPLAEQLIACNDSLLGDLSGCSGIGSERGLVDVHYADLVRDVFDRRFWGDENGEDVCLVVDDAEGLVRVINCADSGPKDFTLLEYNFALFFGLAVQAYEATLFTENTIVDLLAGGVATGAVTRGTGRRAVTISDVAGMPFETCIAMLAGNNNEAATDNAEQICAAHYAKFIHPGAVTGAESGNARFPVDPGTAIGGCMDPLTCNGSPNQAVAINALLNIDRGLGRFFAGATACAVCHFNPEFTGATVSALTGFGAAPVPPLPPGQLRKEALEAPIERMIAFNGQAHVYDAGFYNIGVRPSVEDLSLGDAINGVPLSFAKLREAIALLQSGAELPNPTAIAMIADVIASGELKIPTSPTDLTPRVFDLALACGPGLVGNANAQDQRNGDPNNNPNTNQCIRDVIPGEKILMNGAFKTPGLRNVKFTGPYFHNGAKKNLRQVLETYKTAGHFSTINFNNLDAGMRIFDLGPTDEASVIEMMETGLTDWRVAHDSGKFDHPELCVPHGHDPATGQTLLVSIPAVGQGGHENRLQTFEEQLDGIDGAHSLLVACSMPGIVDKDDPAGRSLIDVPLQAVVAD
ncbi:hypothetical protein CWI75_17290 [Kineobactrum sediminis]|uniref:Di-haem cytochrome c peroxidase domain-containing protein n=1 Tax=Kineobactrum sediminis TaxID=1905677 RepID=A0A2N5XYG6_9GAMM|nr:cytochrome c peroxidase [Kineobactrum sediminis]PLW81187.1 hypothetical protein CWI75_17290 [Kineobactrum sediminis]